LLPLPSHFVPFPLVQGGREQNGKAKEAKQGNRRVSVPFEMVKFFVHKFLELLKKIKKFRLFFKISANI